MYVSAGKQVWTSIDDSTFDMKGIRVRLLCLKEVSDIWNVTGDITSIADDITNSMVSELHSETASFPPPDELSAVLSHELSSVWTQSVRKRGRPFRPTSAKKERLGKGPASRNKKKNRDSRGKPLDPPRKPAGGKPPVSTPIAVSSAAADDSSLAPGKEIKIEIPPVETERVSSVATLVGLPMTASDLLAFKKQVENKDNVDVDDLASTIPEKDIEDQKKLVLKKYEDKGPTVLDLKEALILCRLFKSTERYGAVADRVISLVLEADNKSHEEIVFALNFREKIYRFDFMRSLEPIKNKPEKDLVKVQNLPSYVPEKRFAFYNSKSKTFCIMFPKKFEGQPEDFKGFEGCKFLELACYIIDDMTGIPVVSYITDSKIQYDDILEGGDTFKLDYDATAFIKAGAKPKELGRITSFLVCLAGECAFRKLAKIPQLRLGDLRNVVDTAFKDVSSLVTDVISMIASAFVKCTTLVKLAKWSQHIGTVPSGQLRYHRGVGDAVCADSAQTPNGNIWLPLPHAMAAVVSGDTERGIVPVKQPPRFLKTLKDRETFLIKIRNAYKVGRFDLVERYQNEYKVIFERLTLVKGVDVTPLLKLRHQKWLNFCRKQKFGTKPLLKECIKNEFCNSFFNPAYLCAFLRIQTIKQVMGAPSHALVEVRRIKEGDVLKTVIVVDSQVYNDIKEMYPERCIAAWSIREERSLDRGLAPLSKEAAPAEAGVAKEKEAVPAEAGATTEKKEKTPPASEDDGSDKEMEDEDSSASVKEKVERPST